jgi:adenine-specific DNA-methyltransferase
MGRRWIGIEMGEHARTHCLPRLEKVVAGETGRHFAGRGLAGRRRLSFLHRSASRCSMPRAASIPTCASPRWRPGSGISKPGSRRNASFRFAAALAHMKGTAYYLLYNGILGDRRPAGGNVLTFKQIPYDIKAR